jgi:hypothetical protein
VLYSPGRFLVLTSVREIEKYPMTSSGIELATLLLAVTV